MANTATTSTTEIGGLTYTITILPATVGIKAGLVLLETVGGPLGELIQQAVAYEKGLPIESGSLQSAMRELTKKLGADAFFDLIFRVLDNSKVLIGERNTALVQGANRATFDAHFAKNYLAFCQLLLFAFRENFGGFFDALSANPKVQALTQKTEALWGEDSQSPPKAA